MQGTRKIDEPPRYTGAREPRFYESTCTERRKRERDRERHGGTKRDAEAQIEVARATMHPALRDDLAGKTRRFFYVTSSDATGLRSFCVRAIRTKANPKVF